jgi:hypothetical protein
VSFGEVGHVDARDSGPATRRRLPDREGSAGEPPG